jgi:hypothetical protein
VPGQSLHLPDGRAAGRPGPRGDPVRPRSVINLFGGILALAAIGFGSFAWAADAPPDRPAVLFAYGADGELAPIPATPTSSSPISGQAALWMGLTSLIVNGLVAAWTKQVESTTRSDQREISQLRQALIVKTAEVASRDATIGEMAARRAGDT